MKVSIVIPVYNVAAFIDRCMHSALNQTYPDIEFIVVNDCTPDHSMQLIEELLERHPRKEAVKIISHPVNKGLGAARNTGVKQASGDYIFFLDSDDELSPDCLTILTALAKGRTIDIVIGEIEVIGNKRKAYPPLLLKDGIYHGNSFILQSFLKKEWYEMAWNKLIRRSLFTKKEIWFTEDLLHEDSLWSFQLALHLQSLAVIHAHTYYYHIQGNSITQRIAPKNIESIYQVLQTMIRISEQSHLFEKEKHIFSYLEGIYIFALKRMLSNPFHRNFVMKEKEKLNTLFTNKVWNKKKRPFFLPWKKIILDGLLTLKDRK